MHIRDATRFDIIEMAWKALQYNNEGHAVIVVDVRDGCVEVLSKTEFENWAEGDFDYKKVIFSLKEEEAANLDVGVLYKKYRYEVCCRILEIMEKNPHLI